MAQRTNGHMDFGTLAPLGVVVAATFATVGVDCNVRLSITIAVGTGSRPAASRNSMRK